MFATSYGQCFSRPMIFAQENRSILPPFPPISYTFCFVSFELFPCFSQAAAVLNVTDVVLMDYEDGMVTSYPEAQLREELAIYVRKYQPSVVMTWFPYPLFQLQPSLGWADLGLAVDFLVVDDENVNNCAAFEFEETFHAIVIIAQVSILITRPLESSHWTSLAAPQLAAVWYDSLDALGSFISHFLIEVLACLPPCQSSRSQRNDACNFSCSRPRVPGGAISLSSTCGIWPRPPTTLTSPQLSRYVFIFIDVITETDINHRIR